MKLYADDIDITAISGGITWQNTLAELATTLNFEVGKVNAQHTKIYLPRDGSIGKSKSVIISDAERRIRDIVDAAIADNRDNLRVKSIDEVNEPRLLENLAEHRERGAAETARRLLLDGETPEDIKVSCTYKADDIPDADFLDAITDFEAYCRRMAAEYIEYEQEYMFISFLANDATKAEMLALMNDTENEVHMIAAIKYALDRGGGKMVTVTTDIDGKVLTFKATTSSINRDPCGGTYSPWYIAAADRARFEELYGKRAEYRPRDIVRITYGKSVLYQKNVE